VTEPSHLAVQRSEAVSPETGCAELRICIRVPTDLEVVEEAVDLVARHCLASGVSAQQARFNLRVALCEALSNAIIYGNGLDPRKSVDIEVSLADQLVTVRVTDEGSGFDPDTVPEPSLPDGIEATTGRGLFLIRRLVDRVYFNNRGNAICMVLRRA